MAKKCRAPSLGKMILLCLFVTQILVASIMYSPGRKDASGFATSIARGYEDPDPTPTPTPTPNPEWWYECDSQASYDEFMECLWARCTLVHGEYHVNDTENLNCPPDGTLPGFAYAPDNPPDYPELNRTECLARFPDVQCMKDALAECNNLQGVYKTACQNSVINNINATKSEAFSTPPGNGYCDKAGITPPPGW